MRSIPFIQKSIRFFRKWYTFVKRRYTLVPPPLSGVYARAREVYVELRKVYLPKNGGILSSPTRFPGYTLAHARYTLSCERYTFQKHGGILGAPLDFASTQVYFRTRSSRGEYTFDSICTSLRIRYISEGIRFAVSKSYVVHAFLGTFSEYTFDSNCKLLGIRSGTEGIRFSVESYFFLACLTL